MKKNLKKVISAVIALALSVSSVAMAAPTFTDVAETASYAQAVETLAALGVISGYEDGSFKPDNNITRAEVATMMVAALNRSADAEGSKGTTKFADMNTEAKAWATGFVNIGVAEGFISGYEDGTFQPDNNVTFAEAVSMLVRIAGYGRYADYLGGWPNGYLSCGSQYGITTGVSAGENVAVTRAQVAQLIYNTLLDTPIVEGTTLTTDKNGNLVPDMTIMNGKNDNEWKTLLTEKFDAYYVEGVVTNTNKTSGGSLDADEVDFQIQYTENYNDSEVVIKKGAKDSDGDPITSPIKAAKVGNTDAADYIQTYASAIIQIDDNDDEVFVYFAPSGKNDISVYSTNLIDDDDYTSNNTVFGGSNRPYVKYYATKDATKANDKIYLSYNSSNEATAVLYVNGVEIGAVKDNKDAFENYVVNNNVGEVEYVDAYKTDGNAEYIFVTYYATAQVEDVNVNTGRINFSDGLKAIDKSDNGKSKLTLDPDDEDLVYNITYNGEGIGLDALQQDDVISIAYEVGNFADSNFYEIIVSRDTAEGKYTSKKPNDEMFVVGGTAYETIDKYSDVENATDFKQGDEYTLYLDAFGRIYTYETLASSAKYAIIDKFVTTSGYDYMRATLFLSDGTTKVYEVNTNKFTLTDENGATVKGEVNVNAEILKRVYKNGNTQNPTQNRVVKYKVNSDAQISSLEFVDIEVNKAGNNVAFDSYDNTIGSIRLSDSTKIVNAIDYEEGLTNDGKTTVADLSMASIESFANKTKYVAYAYGDTNSDGSYPFVVVTAGEATFNTETALAVVYEYTGSAIGEDDEDIYGITLMIDGEKKELEISDEAKVNGSTISDTDSFEKGDVVVVAYGNAGTIKEIKTIITAEDLGLESYETVRKNAYANNTIKDIKLPNTDWLTNDKYEDEKNDDEKTVLVFGPVIDKTTSSFRIGDIATVGTENVATDIQENSHTIKTNSDTNVYVWDFSKTSAKYQLDEEGSAASAVVGSSIPTAAYLNSGKTQINWAAKDSGEYLVDPNFALVKTVNGYATEVFFIAAN